MAKTSFKVKNPEAKEEIGLGKSNFVMLKANAKKRTKEG